MEYPVVIQQQDERRYRAFIPFLPECSGDGPSEEAALDGLRQVAQSALARTRLTTIAIDEHLAEEWPHFGVFRDDPTWGAMFDDIERQRDVGAETD